MNKTESVKGRLKKIAVAENKPFNYILMHYFIERLLYRLSVSAYAGNFILKGGLLLYTVLDDKARTTRDIDLLAEKIRNTPDELLGIFTEIAGLPGDDAVSYDTKTITVKRIKEDADYEGIRVKLTGYLDRSRQVLQFDIGFGDVVIPKPVMMTYPSLLDMEAPRLRAYTLESVIAEKFQAGIYLAEANSRMKDFYDLYALCAARSFDGAVLHEAVKRTFERRKTILPPIPTIFTDTFPALPEKQIQWRAFLNRTGIEATDDFTTVMTSIRKFLLPLYNALFNKTGFTGHWDNEAGKWELPGNRLRAIAQILLLCYDN
ncbi:MAG: nucleotidyl transferase AbiEii/AbiGii toxin family protein [Treponema sp.]|nr:nucleotidyl transferase AbiEii/AbiGii toxin family protein [Treponema sp.]